MGLNFFVTFAPFPEKCCSILFFLRSHGLPASPPPAQVTTRYPTGSSAVFHPFPSYRTTSRLCRNVRQHVQSTHGVASSAGERSPTPPQHACAMLRSSARRRVSSLRAKRNQTTFYLHQHQLKQRQTQTRLETLINPLMSKTKLNGMMLILT